MQLETEIIAANLQRAFELQETQARLKEQLSLLEAERTSIINRYLEAGVEREGPFFIETVTAGRRTVDPKLLQGKYPEAWDRCKKVTESCSLADLSKVLSGEQIDEVVKRGSPTLRVGYDIRGET